MNYKIDIDDQVAKKVYNLVRGDFQGLRAVLEVIEVQADRMARKMCLEVKDDDSSYNRGFVRGILQASEFLENAYRVARRKMSEE